MYRVKVFYQDRSWISKVFEDYFTAHDYGVQCVDYGADSAHMLKEVLPGLYDVLDVIAYTIEPGAEDEN